MKFKEFSRWCNERVCDGCWDMKEAIICLNVCSNIYGIPFWKRERAWKEEEKFIVNNIVIPTNKKIKQYFERKVEEQ